MDSVRSFGIHAYAISFSEKPQNIFQTKGHVGNGPRTKKSERELPMPELAIGAWETESLIGNGLRPYGLAITMATK